MTFAPTRGVFPSVSMTRPAIFPVVPPKADGPSRTATRTRKARCLFIGSYPAVAGEDQAAEAALTRAGAHLPKVKEIERILPPERPGLLLLQDLKGNRREVSQPHMTS